MYTTFAILATTALLVGEGLAIDGQWTQCGGKINGVPYGPENTCNTAGGYHCVEVNEWYWQCRNDNQYSAGSAASNLSASYNVSGSSNYVAPSTPIVHAVAAGSPIPVIPSPPPSGNFLSTGSGGSQGGSQVGSAGGNPPVVVQPSSTSAGSTSSGTTTGGTTSTQPGNGGDGEWICDTEEGDEEDDEGNDTPIVQPSHTPVATQPSTGIQVASGGRNPNARLSLHEPGSTTGTFQQGSNGNTGTTGATDTSTSNTTSSGGAGEEGIATTSRYGIAATSLTACGCAGAWMAPGDQPFMGAAINQRIYGDYSKCSGACGTCYELTNLGYSPPGLGSQNQPKTTITVMVLDACPVQGNEQFCSSPNQYGKDTHFDLAIPADLNHGPNQWDNPYVHYKKLASCPTSAMKPRAVTQKRQANNFFSNFKTQCKCGLSGGTQN